MTLVIRVTSCLFALAAALAVFVVGVFAQTGAELLSAPPIALFGLSLALFLVANYYGLLIRDYSIASKKPPRRAKKRQS